MKIIDQNSLLRWGFKYKYFANNSLQYKTITYPVSNNCLFLLERWEYSYDVDGEILVEYKVFKSQRKWLIVYCGKIEPLNAVHPIFTSLTYNDELQFVYFLYSQMGVKIGRTNNIINRKKSFIKLPFKVILYHIITCKNNVTTERNIHEFFKNYRINGEWFDITLSELEHIIQPIALSL